MKQNHPVNGINQSGSRNQSKHFSGAYEYGARQYFYRSVILAVSGSLFCVAAGERAAAQSSGTAPQASGQTQGEAAQSSPPAIFNGLNMIADNQWPSVPLQPATPPLYSPNATPVAPPTQTTPPTPATPVTPLPSSTVNVTNSPAAPAVTTAPVPGADANSALGLPEMPLPTPTVYPNDLSGSADFMYGRGTVTVPIGYGIEAAAPPGAPKFPVNAVSADRSSVYYGGTVSYSYGRNWYLDFSGENGKSTGNAGITIPNLPPGPFPASFDITDTFYQIYLRYNFQNFLAATRFRAYLRGGVSLVEATLTTANQNMPATTYGPGQFYRGHDDTFDVLGNLGFGLTYSLHSTFRWKMGLQLEGEGFGGNRSQDITETFAQSSGAAGKATINDTVYGAIGRLTFHADYKLGQSGRWKVMGDVGMMTKYSFVTYPGGAGTQDELLYGPYVKVGVDFLF
jgi:hypothetical protein